MAYEELGEIAKDALRDMYAEAEPPLDFDHALENPDEMEREWYKNHFLPQDRQTEIVREYCEEHDLSQRECNSLHWTTIVDLGPSSNPPEVIESDD